MALLRNCLEQVRAAAAARELQAQGAGRAAWPAQPRQDGGRAGAAVAPAPERHSTRQQQQQGL